jgi:hypothetical protein
MTTPTITQYTGDVPAKGQTDTVFDANVDSYLAWQTENLAPEMAEVIDWVVDQNVTIQAAAVAANLFDLPLTGLAGAVVGVNDEEDGFEAVEITEYEAISQEDWDAGTSTGEGPISPVKLKGAVEAHGTMVLLDSQAADESAYLDFTAMDNDTFGSYIFVLDDIVNSGLSSSLIMRFSSDGGSTYDSGASDYSSKEEGGSATDGNGVDLSLSLGFGQIGGAEVTLKGCASSFPTWAQYNSALGTSALNYFRGDGCRKALEETDAVRFMFDSEDITSGTIRMYGIRK